jgi:hypothetical protein
MFLEVLEARGRNRRDQGSDEEGYGLLDGYVERCRAVGGRVKRRDGVHHESRF